jgi:carbonic anhydrase
VCSAIVLLAGCTAPQPTSRPSAAPADVSHRSTFGRRHRKARHRRCSFASRPATLRIAHHEHVADGINNGHTIQINYDDGDTLTVGQTTYPLVQYHFHHPSEHTVEGRRYPMEMHLVHRAADGAMAVIGVLIRERAHHVAFDTIWSGLPDRTGEELHDEHITVDIDALLPASHRSYRYEGSLTTPPCTEGVKWFVLTDPIELDSGQIQAFEARVADSSRPLQPGNGRVVLVDVVH